LAYSAAANSVAGFTLLFAGALSAERGSDVSYIAIGFLLDFNSAR
jgi:hypothetical protein